MIPVWWQSQASLSQHRLCIPVHFFFFCMIKHNQQIFLLCLLWELIKAHWTQFDFWHNFDTLLTNDQLFAICLRLQRISDSEFWTVCLGFYPRSHWDHIVQSVKQQSWKTEKNQTWEWINMICSDISHNRDLLSVTTAYFPGSKQYQSSQTGIQQDVELLQRVQQRFGCMGFWRIVYRCIWQHLLAHLGGQRSRAWLPRPPHPRQNIWGH